MSEQEEEPKFRKFIETGAEITGSVSGAAIGFVSAGLEGALGGAFAGPIIAKVFKRTCLDIYDRTSGYRAQVRAGAAGAYAILAIKEKLSKGESLRDDGFFAHDSSRSKADELLEGVIIKCQNEHEEKKARYYANIFATAAFDNRFSPEFLNHVLSIAQALTYRQLCLLRLFAHQKPFQLRDNSFNDVAKHSIPWETHAVLAETFDLYQRSLISQMIPKGSDLMKNSEEWEAAQIVTSDDMLELSGITDIEPNNLSLTEIGKRVYFLMQLETLSEEDLQRVAGILG